MPVTKNQALDYHFGERHGKMEVTPSKPSRTQPDLNLAYTPGIADPCLEIQKSEHDAFKYTARKPRGSREQRDYAVGIW